METWQGLLFRTQIEALVTEREAMKAENERRRDNNMTQAYDEAAFQTLVGQFAGIEERIRGCS